MSTDAFSYMVSIKLSLSNNSMNLLQNEYPGATDMTLASRDFADYSGCVTSCKQLMDDLCAKANAAATAKQTYKISSEINPVHTGVATLSTDWAPAELARIWVFDAEMEKSRQIQAIGQARVFKSSTGIQPVLS